MPTDYIKKLSKEGKGSVATLESKWAEAKAQANKAGKANNFAYITSIFQNMINAKIKDPLEAGAQPMQLNARARLLATMDTEYGEALFKEMTKDLDVHENANEEPDDMPIDGDNDK